jgi:uracil-DNA glycosylase family 4
MDKQVKLAQIEKNVKNCKACRLCENTLNAVPGEGNPNSDIAFVGEAPGKYEDQTGRPFVGRAGKLLEQMLEKIGYTREDVWIGNVIKHRPPENRDPLPDEIKACEPYLTMQLETINPKLVVTLGRFAMSYFHKDGKISRDRGQLIVLDLHNVYPVYHPAAALRNGDMARALLKDFMKIPEVLEQIEKDSKKINEERKKILMETNPLGLGV